MQVTQIQKFVVNGVEFGTKEEAQAHAKIAPRLAQLEAASISTSQFTRDDRGVRTLDLDHLHAFLANNGDALVAALTIVVPKKTRAKRTPAAPTA